MKFLLLIGAMLFFFPVFPLLALSVNYIFRRHQAKIARQKRNKECQPLRIPLIGSLEVTPIVEFFHLDGFIGEAGVAYHLKTEVTELIMDFGYNKHHVHPSPFFINARRLGIDFSKISSYVVSHFQLDHIGGMRNQMTKWLYIPMEVSRKPRPACYVPDIAYSDVFIMNISRQPQSIDNTCISTGAIPLMNMFMGWVEEQFLLFHLRGKGLVLVSGCGLRGVEEIMKRVRCLSQEKIYAFVGGFHFPVTQSRHPVRGFNAQIVLGMEKWPWQGIAAEEMQAQIQLMKQEEPARVLLSGHDTCDYAIEVFRREFGARFGLLRAGEKIAL
jgi:7,8-dihydropterin-6-yl-methyl-4-(beta-D-ribofuranosyl)aminobenzene 5'-phosphate synthase